MYAVCYDFNIEQPDSMRRFAPGQALQIEASAD
jgi:hypothetical protein